MACGLVAQKRVVERLAAKSLVLKSGEDLKSQRALLRPAD
jgi:hypothetical protein